MTFLDILIGILLLAVVILGVTVCLYVARMRQLSKNLELVMMTLALASPAIARRLEERGTQVVVNGGDGWEEEREWQEPEPGAE